MIVILGIKKFRRLGQVNHFGQMDLVNDMNMELSYGENDYGNDIEN